jgi:ABC-type multidrug transport system fused ATPase/permease subunit
MSQASPARQTTASRGPTPDAAERLKRFSSANWREALRRNWAAFFFFFGYVKPYYSKVFLAVVAKLIATPMQMISVFIGASLIDDVVLNNSLGQEERLTRLVTIIGIQFALWCIGQLQNNIFSWISWYVGNRLTLDVQRRFYLHEQSLPLSWHRKRSIGEHIFRTESDVNGGVISMVTNDWIAIFDVIYQLFWAAVLFWRIDPVLGIIAGGYMIPWTIITQVTNSIWVRFNYQSRELSQEVQSVERDIIAGLRTYKSLGRTRFVANRYGQCQTMVYRMSMKGSVLDWLLNGALWFTVSSQLYDNAIRLYTWASVMTGHFTIGETTVVLWIMNSVLSPYQSLFNLVQAFRQKMVPAQRMLETLRTKPLIVDKPRALRAGALRGSIVFESVSFAHEQGPRVVDNVSFDVRAGERVALVGRSGCGKSTILNLALRLHDPQEGRVLIDGVDLRDYRLRSYLRNVGVVLQETFMFAGSAADNVRYGEPLASRSEVRDALSQADLDDSIAAWPEGMDAFMGEGTNLSGGQKQRIGIARALVRKPSIFVMDEPTAHLDVVAETHVFSTIERVTRARTTLIVSHRITPILFVDRIIVLTPAGVEAMGTHAELLQSSPTYRTLWAEQQQG